MKELITKKWEETGMLDGVDMDMKDKLLISYEEAYQTILGPLKKEYDEIIEVVIYPIVRMVIKNIYTGCNFDDNEANLWYKVKFLKNKEKILEDKTGVYIAIEAMEKYPLVLKFFTEFHHDRLNKVDVEAQACYFLAEQISIKYLNEYGKLLNKI